MKLNLISQVYFPRELLIFIELNEIFVDFAFNFITLMVINLLLGIAPNVNFVFLPLILLIQAALTLGIMLFVSSLSVIVRDIPQLIGVALQILFYLTAILYPLDRLSPDLKTVVSLNPLSSVIAAYREVILYNRPPDITSLYYPLVVALTVLYLGYSFFKSQEKQFADYI
jgi:ABC-2 type transport system permease protein